ncbi:MAG: DUF2244 domain-containing protein [Maritimibacter sp.]
MPTLPYEWTKTLTTPPPLDAPGFKDGAAPLLVLQAWPYRSLPKKGFVVLMGGAYTALLLLIIGFVGTAALWWLLCPGLIALYGLWWFIDRNYRDGEILETLEVWADHIRLMRDGPHKAQAIWEANPYWVTVQFQPKGPVPAYLTLKGAGREVELGAFLSESERRALHHEIAIALTRVRSRQNSAS